MRAQDREADGFQLALGELAAESLSVAAVLAVCWLFFNTSSPSPGNWDPRSAYANMAALYAYFVIFLAICFAVDFSAPCRKGLSLLLLGGALASYPFLFIATHHGVVIDYPRTGSFPFYHAILEAKHIPWPRIFDDPWSVLTSTRFGSAGPLISDLSPLIRTKMPGFALMAKLLSYVVFDQRSYLFAVSSITVVSQLLIARALLKGSLRGIRWDLVALLPAAGFVIQPYGVEQLCMVYLGLCLYFLYRFNLGLTDGA